MRDINESYGRDLDLNLLRVFVVVAETRSVTRAAQRLYLTQPAVSAAMGRLTRAIGAPLLVRRGRGLDLTQRGERLLRTVAPRLEEIVRAALSPAAFDPRKSDRIVRLGVSDAMEGWLLPRLLRGLGRAAPGMRVITLPVTFRSVADVLTSGAVDMAVTVADELPASIKRLALAHDGFVCLYDPRCTRLGKAVSEQVYFQHEHVIVSYNGDLRGVVEDVLHKQRRVRCALSSFSHIGSAVDGSALLATVPALVARHVRRALPHLRTAKLPFEVHGVPLELLWPAALDDDEACRFVRGQIQQASQQEFARARPRAAAQLSRKR